MASSKAQAFKEKGNAAFKSADYPTAIGHYTSAILADPDRKDITFPLNRAAAYLKLGKYADTERDCNTVLSISRPKSNVKALFRRGQARVGLGKLLEAHQDFTDVLAQEPSNAAASEELRNVANLIQKEKAKKAKVLPGSVPPTTASVSPAAKRRRVPIRIVGDVASASANGASTSNSSPTTAPNSTTSQTTTTPSSSDTHSPLSTLLEPSSSSMSINTSTNDTLQPISSRSLKPLPSDKMDVDSSSEPTPPTQATSAKAKSEPSSFKEAKQARDAKSPRVGGGIFRVSGQNTIFAPRGGSDPDMATAKEEEEENKEKKQEDVEMEIVSPSQLLPTSRASSMQVSPSPQLPPTTLFDFSRMWYALKSPWEKWAFLNTVPPAQFPALCKTSLEPSLLVDIFDVFLTVLTASVSASASGVNNNNNNTPQDVGVGIGVDIDSDSDFNFTSSHTHTHSHCQSQSRRPSDSEEKKKKMRIREYMDAFARVPRFGTLVLFLSGKEKEVVRKVWSAIGVGGDGDGDGLEGMGVWRNVWGGGGGGGGGK